MRCRIGLFLNWAVSWPRARGLLAKGARIPGRCITDSATSGRSPSGAQSRDGSGRATVCGERKLISSRLHPWRGLARIGIVAVGRFVLVS